MSKVNERLLFFFLFFVVSSKSKSRNKVKLHFISSSQLSEEIRIYKNRIGIRVRCWKIGEDRNRKRNDPSTKFENSMERKMEGGKEETLLRRRQKTRT